MSETSKTSLTAVILGGHSKEREVSLKSGAAVIKALESKGHSVMSFDPAQQSWAELIQNKVSQAFIALHGQYGEDGCTQGLLENLKIPYTGSGVLSSAICFDKIRTKRQLSHKNVLTPQFWVFQRGENLDAFIEKSSIQVPVVAKPNREGSSFGTTIVREQGLLKKAIQEAASFSPNVLIEEFIDGKELTVGLLNGKALSTVEICPKSGFYDYQSKYTAGATEYFSPARLDPKILKTLESVSELVVEELECRGAPRVDFMVQGDQCYFLEVNTIPGMTETSLLPKSAGSQNIDFASLCESILHQARLDY